jgi:hypothetical protein
MSVASKSSRERKPYVGYSDECANYIVSQIVDEGRLLVDVCGDDGMPNRSSVYRWLADRPDFAARVDRAREAAADHSVSKARAIAEKCTSETANADRVKISHYQWEATRMAPKKYSERRLSEVLGKDDSPLIGGNQLVTLDASKLSFEERQLLRKILQAAKEAPGGPAT